MGVLYFLRTYTDNPATRAITLLFSGQVIMAIAGLVLGKAIALYIPPTELGDYNLLLSGLSLAHVVLIVPVLQAFKTHQAQFGVRAAFPFYSRLIGIAYGLCAGVLLVFGYIYDQFLLALLISAAGIGQGFYSGSIDYLNLTGKHRFYTAIQLGYSIGNLLLFALLVIGYHQATSLGLWVCLALSNVLFASVSFIYSYKQVPATRLNVPGLPTVKAFWQYASPLLALSLWGWVINYGDRYLISLYLSEADVGQYSVGYGLGSKLVILVSPFVVHSTRRVYALRAANVPTKAVWLVQRKYLFTYAAIAGSACVAYLLLHNQLGLLLLSDTYRTAFQIGPIIAFGYLFLTLIHLLEVQWYAYGYTRLTLWTTLAGAMANIGLNLIFIPYFGLIGAAFASLLGFLIQFLVACFLYKSRLS